MINLGKYKILKTKITATNYEFILSEIIQRIKFKKRFLVSPIASQTIVKAYFNPNLQNILDKFDLLLPDSQWVKKSLKLIYGVELRDRVYGPKMMLNICKLSETKGLRIFLIGPTKEINIKLTKSLTNKFPHLIISGSIAILPNEINEDNRLKIIDSIEKSQATIIFIGLGSPQQEIFSHYLIFKKPFIQYPLILIPVGAAFDLISGTKPQAPKWMQDSGFEWLFRLITEPKRLWVRYLILGPLFIILIILQKIQMVSKSIFDFFIFTQKRIGKNNNIFTIYKFRTMIPNAEKFQKKYASFNQADGPVFKIQNDPRYTKIGKFLAHTGLDEVPQFINVIKGEMAIVGPRPLPVHEAKKIPTIYKKRFSVLPGITSPWVINGSHKLSFKEWMNLDLKYIKEKNFWLDLKITGKTILMCLKYILINLRNYIVTIGK